MAKACRTATLAVLLVVLVVACASDPAATAQPSGGLLQIEWPPEGAAVCTDVADAVFVTGHAPPGSRVVHDIPLAQDGEDVADADGEWEITALVDEGANELRFRLGDDFQTERTVRFTFRRVGSMPQPDCVDAVGPATRQ